MTFFELNPYEIVSVKNSIRFEVFKFERKVNTKWCINYFIYDPMVIFEVKLDRYCQFITTTRQFLPPLTSFKPFNVPTYAAKLIWTTLKVQTGDSDVGDIVM